MNEATEVNVPLWLGFRLFWANFWRGIIGMVLLGMVFDRNYGRLSVRLVDPATGERLPRKFWNSFRLFWSHIWRIWVISMLAAIPLGFLSGGEEFEKAVQAQKTYTECNELLTEYREYSSKPEAVAKVTRVTNAFNARDCRTVLAAPPPPRQEVPLSVIIGGIVGFIGGLFIQFKIFQILARKRYRAFHVQVTPRA